MPRWLKPGVPIMSLLLLGAIPPATTVETGSLKGMITDDRGPVARALVQVRNAMSGQEFETKSDPQGLYQFELAPERYSLWVAAPGHDSVWIPEMVVERGRVTTRDIRLDRSGSRPTG